MGSYFYASFSFSVVCLTRRSTGRRVMALGYGKRRARRRLAQALGHFCNTTQG
jgi:hypothetical protein